MRFPVSYDPVKEGFGVRVYRLNPDKKNTDIAQLKGLKDNNDVSRASARSNSSDMFPPPPKDASGSTAAAADKQKPVLDPHVVTEPVIDLGALEKLKKESRVTLMMDAPAK